MREHFTRGWAGWLATKHLNKAPESRIRPTWNWPDLSLPDAESTRVEEASHAEPDPSLPSTEESSLQDTTPAEQFSSFAVTYEIVKQSSIMTNNGIEGWHLGLNRRAAGKSQLPLYLLISLLHREAHLTSLQWLVSERKLRRNFLSRHCTQSTPKNGSFSHFDISTSLLFATRSYGNDLKFVSNWLQCLLTSQPAHPRVKCYIIARSVN